MTDIAIPLADIIAQRGQVMGLAALLVGADRSVVGIAQRKEEGAAGRATPTATVKSRRASDAQPSSTVRN